MKAANPFPPIRHSCDAMDYMGPIYQHDPAYGGTHILSIGDDELLLSSRQMVLESEGYFVHSMWSHARVDDDCVRESDLAILCHSIESSLKLNLARRLLCANPSLYLILLTTQDSYSIGPPHTLRGTSNHPNSLLTLIAEMMATKRSLESLELRGGSAA